MRVLVADDDSTVRLIGRTVVEELGHECAEAANGHEAWAEYQRFRPHVLVTDRLMPPGPDGLQLCRDVRDRERNTGYTYIVLLTSLAKRHEVLEGIHAGADDYVAKPVDPFALHSRLLVAHRVTATHVELARARAELARQAHTDPLTGLRNRLRLTEDLHDLHERSVRYGRPYSLALCDVDFFKAYNDSYGHQRGDRALQAVADVLATSGRRGEGVYRYGGEEFLHVLPEQPGPNAVAALERFRAHVEQLGIPNPSAPAGVLTVSVGIATYVPGRSPTEEDTQTSGEAVLRQADIALYEAKAAGRNTVGLAASYGAPVPSPSPPGGDAIASGGRRRW
jgi:two-component system chemotaxis response regulator CheY